ncbi:hypothetical protein [Vandammella animalimorsus]|uniref:hypothetical protein n=1 Tax=Vandammella animalimorsus TaxID=2029117 RepID=UPI00117F82CC|nr:hypothetical protein [Vandammella animalimorsus]
MQKPKMTNLEIERIHAEISKLMAETMKLNAEASKLQRERYWYPMVVACTALGAGLAIAKLLS